MALYADNGGAPGMLQAKTASAAIVAGSNVIPVVAQAAIPAGTYWIAGEYDNSAEVCFDNATTNQLDYVSVAYGTVPDPFGKPTLLMIVDLNYYVVGIP
jgi:hypothetical protein